MTAAQDLYYVSSSGDVLDQVVAKHYGDTRGGKVEKVLAANPDLASKGAVLPAGVRITLPALDLDTPPETAQLWG